MCHFMDYDLTYSSYQDDYAYQSRLNREHDEMLAKMIADDKHYVATFDESSALLHLDDVIIRKQEKPATDDSR